MNARHVVGLALLLAVVLGPPGARSEAQGPAADLDTLGRTPPRLAFVDGQVSSWRPGAPGWMQASINTPLAPGDELYTGSPGSLELQIGARAFVRAWANTQLGFTNQEPDFLQFKVTGGYASFDVRALDPGRAIEVDTPNAALTIEHPGYYRVDVTGGRTSIITRRGGHARVTTATGDTVALTPSEEVVVEGSAPPRVASYVAPPLDAWDQWNYARTDGLLEAVSARYVSADVYGASDLDRYGTWRVVPTYGSVWVPAGVAADWAPYTTGAWTLDPYYGWTWVDTAPWGWAPYHHGRWVNVDGFWAWAPGPVVARAVYAPALVAFFGAPGVTVGGPHVGWVALGWGEPIVPWWGPAGHIHVASWAGWGGPRVVNNVVIERTTVVNVTNITVYRNAAVRNAVVVVGEEHFGRGVVGSRMTQIDVRGLQPIHTAPRVSPTSVSFVATSRRGVEPPREQLAIPVVATRPPRAWSEPAAEAHKAHPAALPAPAPRLVTPPSRESTTVPFRPPFGESKTERAAVEHRPSPAPPQPQGLPRGDSASPGAAPSGRQKPATSAKPESRAAPSPSTPQAPTRTQQPPLTPAAPPPGRITAPQSAPVPRVDATHARERQLPGEPANRLFPGRAPADPSTPPQGSGSSERGQR